MAEVHQCVAAVGSCVRAFILHFTTCAVHIIHANMSLAIGSLRVRAPASGRSRRAVQHRCTDRYALLLFRSLKDLRRTNVQTKKHLHLDHHRATSDTVSCTDTQTNRQAASSTTAIWNDRQTDQTKQTTRQEPRIRTNTNANQIIHGRACKERWRACAGNCL